MLRVVRFLSVLSLLIMMAACSSHVAKPESGHPLYTEHPWVENARIWVKPGFSFTQLTEYSEVKVLQLNVDRVSGEYIDVSSAELEMMRTFLPSMLSEVFNSGSDQLRVDESHKKVSLQVTVLEASRVEPDKSVLDYIPFRLAIDLGKSAYNSYSGLEERLFKAAFRVNAYDAASGTLLFSIEDQIVGEPYSTKIGSHDFIEILSVLQSWVERLRTNYDKALLQERVIQEI